MATINGLDQMSYAELLKLQERVGTAIADKRVEDAASTKEQLHAVAEKAGFNLNELFGSAAEIAGDALLQSLSSKAIG